MPVGIITFAVCILMENYYLIISDHIINTISDRSDNIRTLVEENQTKCEKKNHIKVSRYQHCHLNFSTLYAKCQRLF